MHLLLTGWFAKSSEWLFRGRSAVVQADSAACIRLAKVPCESLQRNDYCNISNAMDFIPGSVMDLQSDFRHGISLHCAPAAPIKNTIPTFRSHFATS